MNKLKIYREGEAVMIDRGKDNFRLNHDYNKIEFFFNASIVVVTMRETVSIGSAKPVNEDIHVEFIDIKETYGKYSFSIKTGGKKYTISESDSVSSVSMVYEDDIAVNIKVLNMFN